MDHASRLHIHYNGIEVKYERRPSHYFRNGLIPFWIKMMCNAQRTRLLLAALEARGKKRAVKKNWFPPYHHT